MLLTRLKLRLARWWKRLIGRLPDAAAINGLPFEPDELARLIRRGRREDFEKLVAGFSKRSTDRLSSKPLQDGLGRHSNLDHGPRRDA
jgi:hypothetical protein